MKFGLYKIHRLSFIFLLIAGALLPIVIQAQDQEIKASAPGIVSVGKAFNYTLSAKAQGQVTLGDVKGIRVISGPRQMVSYQSSNVNGQLTATMQVNYSYMMVAESEGEHTIPPATLKADGRNLKSNPVKIKAVTGAAQPKASGDPNQTETPSEPPAVIMKLIPSDTDLYEGEQLVVSTKIYVRTRIERPSLKAPSYEGFWVEALEPDATARNEVVEGVNYNSQIVKRDLLTAQRKGKLRIGQASLDVTILKRAQRRRSRFDNFFDDPFFSDPFERYEKETIVVKSNPLDINIKALPSMAPDGFNGAVGDFSVSTMLKEDSVQTNNALSLVFEIRGKGNLNLIEAPRPDFPPDLEVFDPKRTETISHSTRGTEGRLRFEYVIIPRHNGNYRISPLKYSYFNPDKEEYISYQSPEFRFIAYGGEDGGDGSGGLQSGFFREEVRDIERDIRFIKLDPGKLTPAASFLIVKTWVYIYIFGGLALLILAVVFWRNKLKREADVFYVRNKKAHKVAKTRFRNANKLLEEDNDTFFEEILKAFWGYLGDRMAINTADLSKDRISAELEKRDIDKSLQEQLWEIVEECEYSRYSPESSGGKEQLFKKAVECMQKLEQNI